MKKIYILLFVLFFFVSCEEAGRGVIIDHKYTSTLTMINNSGVQVAVVAGNKDFPDSLVLLSGAKYKWIIPSFEWPFNECYQWYRLKVYFDEDILIVHNYDDKTERNPGFVANYEYAIIDKYNDNYTFIFTPEDYQNALTQQK